MTPQELVTAWKQWCVDNQCDVNSFCTSATKKLVEMIEEGDLLAKRKGKADMKEFEYDYETMEIKYKGIVIGKWNNEAHYDYPEDLTWDRDIGSFAREMFLAGRTATLKEILEALPDDNELLDCYRTVWNGQNSPNFEEGFKGSSNYIRAIIEKKLEGK